MNLKLGKDGLFYAIRPLLNYAIFANKLSIFLSPLSYFPLILQIAHF